MVLTSELEHVGAEKDALIRRLVDVVVVADTDVRVELSRLEIFTALG